ncbi:YbjN domain-containing protein [Allorhodopirellula solitaria]|uniref:Uncharacterized protein n=1 Tax=Allorhodopirellula solitaria TaxID=2527987 RepID=A0A5C5XVJ6_9BACT|nr:YbjN domain-containing protein [Allorhodopirellula solitaria]TWT66708.1 hypothetical protein CA85_28050 [Allorhodopirellula solitaria]
MTTDWVQMSKPADFSIEGSQVEVSLRDGRKHRVEVIDRDGELVLRAFVVKQQVVKSSPTLPLTIWKRNRSVSLVAFRIDRKNRLIAECRAPASGLTPEEFQFYLRTIAVEADRLEFLLTGRDQE